jgi:hypothetical protein
MESESGFQSLSVSLLFCQPEPRSRRDLSRRICRENNPLLPPQRCHPEERSDEGSAVEFSCFRMEHVPCATAVKITPCYHHSAVILSSAAAKDPRLNFHASGWNTLRCPTDLKIDGEPLATATRVVKFPEGTQEDSPGWPLTLTATKVKGESWGCTLHDLSAPEGRSNTSAFSWSPGERPSIPNCGFLLIAPELSFAVSQRLAKVQNAS